MSMSNDGIVKTIKKKSFLNSFISPERNRNSDEYKPREVISPPIYIQENP